MKLSLLCLLYIQGLHTVSASFHDALDLSFPLLVRDDRPVSNDGNCGFNSDVNATCLTSKYGNCCSITGFCGKTSKYCDEGCHPGFGKCNSESGGKGVSISGSCGKTDSGNLTCKGSTFGDCCSSLGFCGGNSTYCGAGCQSDFGTCLKDDSATSTTTPSATSTGTATTYTSTGLISLDGNCGFNSDSHALCLGSEFGDCCSAQGYCGGNSGYCEEGCQPEFGNCGVEAEILQSPSLSKGAKAGIGIGAAAGALAAIAFALWLVKRRKNPRSLGSEIEDNAVPHSPSATIAGTDPVGQDEVHQKHGEEIFEKHTGRDSIAELPDNQSPVEIGGSDERR